MTKYDPTRAKPETVAKVVSVLLASIRDDVPDERCPEYIRELREQCRVRLRTRAEVDAERLLNLDAWKCGAIDGRTLCTRDNALCVEETSDVGPSRADAPETPPAPPSPAGAASSEPEWLQDPPLCGCEEAEALRAEVERLRRLTEDKHAPNTLEWRQLVDEQRGQMHGALEWAKRNLGEEVVKRLQRLLPL